MSATTATTLIKTFSISTALLASGAIASLSLFDIPELQSQPASRSLPQIRWPFSRGSHIFPSASFISSAGFVYLAYLSSPRLASRALIETVWRGLSSGKVRGYLVAAALTFSIAPFTAKIMIPTNFALIKLNADLGGARSEEAGRRGDTRPGGRSALDSVNGEGEGVGQWRDVSGPQEKTLRDGDEEDDRRARELLGKFGRLNLGRSVLMGLGGIVGLITAIG
ncbi:hypothetical protein KC318_g167 [Hortaea werneckii]|uniref:DUF1772 domain-containing protein n=1 Tax=Hortaea werneckii TaxID=91943 RepID=A0A3M7ADF5_HORWE|nr:hypothetical protein KC334_g178 [Hortaea werneckii]KAI7027870.1 hypothetical protein KC355_g168 [Hortaea werneckii]KAI7676577.1 hypothetical protein KC318_g167 [Hortaea werneckii]RMY18516.1 hypothetical protein D0866_13149 [Hortaea werneckii]RMY25565.1 hypothetical protein D0867_00654 [Hortaea werneckii]